MDQVLVHLPHEEAPGERLPEDLVPVRHEAAGGGGKVERTRHLGPRQDPAHAVREVRLAQDPFRAPHPEVRVPGEVLVGTEVMPPPDRMIVPEPVPPVVAVPPELGDARLRLELPAVRPEAEVAAVDAHHPAGAVGSDHPSAPAVGPVNPVVETVLEPVHAVLLVPFTESAEEGALEVGFPVAVRVFGVDDFGGGADNHALPPRHHAGREIEPGKKQGRFVVPPVAVRVLQKPHVPARLPLSVDTHRIIPHLDDPELSVRAPLERDGISYERFLGHKLDGVARVDPKGLHRLSGGERGRQEPHHELLERPPVHVIAQAGRILVLHPEMARVEPRPVVRMRSPPDDHGNRTRIAAPAGCHGAGPSHPRKSAERVGARDEQRDRVSLLVRNDDVGVAVPIDVHEPKPAIAPLAIDQGSAPGQRPRESLPGFLFRRPLEDGVLRFVRNDQVASALVLDVAQPGTPVPPPADGEHGLPLQLQSAEQFRRLHPGRAVKVPAPRDAIAPRQERSKSVGAHDAEPDARRQLHRESRLRPATLGGHPEAGLPHPPVPDHDVQVAVGVEIDQPDPVIPAVVGSKRVSPEQVRVQPLLRLAKREELHLFPVARHGVVDELDDLAAAEPVVRVEDQREDALLQDRRVDGELEVAHGGRIDLLRPVERLRIVRDRARELPARPADHVGIRIVLHVIHERVLQREIPAEPLPAVGREPDLPREIRVFRREEMEDGTVDREEVPLPGPGGEELREEARAGRIERVAPRHPEGDWPAAGHRRQEVDAPFVGRSCLLKVPPLQQRVRMIDRMRLEADPLLQPRLELRIFRVNFAGHDADRRAPVDLLEPVENRPQPRLVPGGVPHVVDREDDDGFHPLFPHPLRGLEPREFEPHIVGVASVEVGQPVRVGLRNSGGEKERDEPGGHGDGLAGDGSINTRRKDRIRPTRLSTFDTGPGLGATGFSTP